MHAWMRIFAFAFIYFVIHLIFFVTFIVRTYMGMPEASWYLQHPFEALRIIVLEATRNLMLTFPFFLLAIYSVVIGFATDLVWTYLVKRFRRRAPGAE